MTDANFIEQMQEALRQQQAQDESAIKNKEHEAHVREADGPKKWLALKALVMESVGDINGGFPSAVLAYSDDLNSFTVRNELANRVATATFNSANGTISYQSSAASGTFHPGVTGNELEYSWQKTIPSRGVTVTVQGIGNVVTIENMSEVLIRCIVSP
jgi:hypothetical protein